MFLKSVLDGSEWSALSYGRFTPYTQRVEIRVGYSARMGIQAKSFLPRRIQNLDSSHCPSSSHHTDCSQIVIYVEFALLLSLDFKFVNCKSAR
jgi:hypothetical protein